LDIPRGTTSGATIPPPTYLGASIAHGEARGMGGGESWSVLDFQAGGVLTDGGARDPNVIVAINNTHLYFTSGQGQGQRQGQGQGQGQGFIVRPLPVAYAAPLTWGYDASGAPIVGPVSHGKTVWLAVLPSNAHVVAVTGRPSISNNTGAETVWWSQVRVFETI
jgi:hypothetical protein